MRYFVGLMICVFCVPVLAFGEAYHWPMDAPPALTSTFGEYRGGRLHAAVDLKTWGKEGYPVTAIDDGYVWRVRTSPWGYGRVVYVRLNNGLFALWAHLSGFSDKIEEYVKHEQERHGTYSVNLYFRPDQLPVKRGDVVGFSGSTGIGVPHLHFEMRDDKHHPINPLTHGFDVKDTIPPTLTAIGFAPLDALARVNGRYNPVALTLRDRGKYYAPADTVVIWGRVGVGVKVFDRANASELTNRLAPYQMQLWVNDKVIFDKTLGKFSYDVTHHGELAFDFFMSRRGLGRFHSLYRKKGNNLPFYGQRPVGEGVLFADIKADGTGQELAQGVHEIKVVAQDVKGNRSEARVVVRVMENLEIQKLETVWSEQAVQVQARVDNARRVAFEQSGDDGKTWSMIGRWRDVRGSQIRHTVPRAKLFRMLVQGADGLEAFQTFGLGAENSQITSDVVYFPTFAVIHVEAEHMLDTLPQMSAELKGRTRSLLVSQTGMRSYETVVAFDPRISGTVNVHIDVNGKRQTIGVIQQTVTPQKGGEMVSVDGRVRARFEKNKVYLPLFGHIVPDSVEQDDRMVGPAFRIAPDDVAFEEAELAFIYPKDYPEIDKLGIYEWNDKKGWVFVDMGRDSILGAVTGKVKHFGRFAMLVDNVPPVISRIIPADGALVDGSNPKIVVHVKDVSSGIWREEDMIMRIDGIAQIVEYDPEEDVMFVTPRTSLDAGEHELEVIVRDICGNEARSTSMFRITLP